MARTREQRRRHAEYIRAYNSRPEAHLKKLLRDRKYREKNLAKIREYDRRRNKSLERRAAKYCYGKNLREGTKRAKVLDYGKRYYRKHKEESQASSLRRRARFSSEEWSEIQRRYGLKHKYGITVEEYDKLLRKQRGRCAICNTKQGAAGQNGRLHVDHDHRTKIVRGLLCMHCNHSMERVDNCPDWLERVGVYSAKLKRPR